MNVLLFSQAAWDDINSYGNTVSNFFCGWNDDKFYHFYTRRQLPQNGQAEKYYNQSVIDIIKECLGKKTDSYVFSKDEIENKEKFFLKEIEKEKGAIDKIHKGKSSLVYFISEIIWLSRVWMKKEFRDFVNEANPDVFFAFAIDSYNLWPVIKYIKKNTKAKIVLFIADDVHNDIKSKAFFRRIYLNPTYNKCINSADKLYGISPAMCQEYEKLFGKEVKLLLKGCDLTVPVAEKNNNPKKIVYAGNLYYGRAETLSKVAKILKDINAEKQKMILEIYTPATITEEMDKNLNIEGVSKVMGARSYEEIKKINSQADIVLHVESFEKEQMNTVRYSFSTKIIDYMQSGSNILAVGPAGIASMDYIEQIPGAIVANNTDKLKSVLEKLADTDSSEYLNSSANIRKFAEKNHDINIVRENLRRDFEELIKEA